MVEQNWITVLTHRNYEIKILDGATSDFGYIVDDHEFLPDNKRFKTVAEAVKAIDDASR